MTCEELLKALNEYVDGAQLTEICEEFSQHLAGCNPCQVVVDNIRQTIRLYKNGESYQLPPAFAERLHGVLRARWHQAHPPATGPAAARLPQAGSGNG